MLSLLYAKYERVQGDGRCWLIEVKWLQRNSNKHSELNYRTENQINLYAMTLKTSSPIAHI